MDVSSTFYDNELAADLRREHRTLLSIGMSEDEAQERLLRYFDPQGASRDYEATYWIALAYSQWQLGRPNPAIIKRAIGFLEERICDCSAQRTQLLQKIYNALLSPAPPLKKIRKPATLHCPWPEGSLLAYRIVNNSTCADHPCFGKYALLRVVKVDRKPVSRLAPSVYYDEIMRVSVYGWVGDHIPDPAIVDRLSFIPIPHQGMWVVFMWAASKYEKPDITPIGCDKDFRIVPPNCLDFNVLPYTITSYLPFDATLVKCLLPFLGKENI